MPPRHLSIMRWLLASLLLVSLTAVAQDALRGKRLYLETARLTGSTVSCVDCHGGLPPGAFGIGRAANSPSMVANAIATIPQMAPLRGRLSTQDIDDLAAYIGNPAVPSPVLRIDARAPDGTLTIDRIDFGVLSAGTTATGTIRFTNSGQLPLQWTSSARLVGAMASEFTIEATECSAGAALGAGAACEMRVSFSATPTASGTRTAALQIDHDWVGATAAVALVASVASSAANPPIGIGGTGGGGGSLSVASMLALLLLRLPQRRLQLRAAG